MTKKQSSTTDKWLTLARELEKRKEISDKVRLWREKTTYDLFHAIVVKSQSGKDVEVRLISPHSPAQDQIYIIKESLRFSAEYQKVLRKLDEFKKTIEGLKSITLTQKKYIMAIMQSVEPNVSTHLSNCISLGFNAFYGRNDLDEASVRLYRAFTYSNLAVNHFNLSQAYYGFCLGWLKKTIEEYSESDSRLAKRPEQRIKVNVPAQTFAAIVKILERKGVLDLVYIESNRKMYNGALSAELIKKHFLIQSQKGKNSGKEVKLSTLQQAFKPGIVNDNSENEFNKFLSELNKLPDFK